MAGKKPLDGYRKSLLNRVTVNAAITEYIENSLTREDEARKHSFHKIMVHNWSGTDIQLFEIMSDYFSSPVIPIMYSSQSEITSFYTSSLGLILKIIRLDFMFPFQRNMFNIDILFNDKSSANCFHNSISLEDIVYSIVSRRLNEKFELDLSNFCTDPEFEDKKIHFYNISLLSHFKLLMLRVGRDTKTINLSNNNLSQVPLDILNFFIKGDLTAINLSHNKLPSVQELLRVSSKIEKLWLEGNPLCEDLDAHEYVKVLAKKFPRLMELDGIKINQHGFVFPFFKNFLVTPDRKTKMLVEKFLMIYFTHYDSAPRIRFQTLYGPFAVLTINTAFSEEEERDLPAYANHSRNAMEPKKREWMRYTPRLKMYMKQGSAAKVLTNLPPATHDPSTFTVDVLLHTAKAMILVIDGIYREKYTTALAHCPESLPEYRYFSFRRTFVFKIHPGKVASQYEIENEMFSVRPANKEQIENSFKQPIMNMNQLALVMPGDEEIDAVIKAFMHLSGLKRSAAEARLKLHDWDIKQTLKQFVREFKENKVPPEHMIEEDDFSDTSSLVEDEID